MAGRLGAGCISAAMPPWWTTRYIDTETVAVVKASALTPAIRHASANVYIHT